MIGHSSRHTLCRSYGLPIFDLVAVSEQEHTTYKVYFSISASRHIAQTEDDPRP